MTQSMVLAAPHAHDDSSIRGIMLTVCVSLVPCTALGLWCYGWPALNLLVVTVGSTMAFEALALRMRGQKVGHRLADGSAVVAGWLLALTLPPWAPWWLAVLGAGVAMLLAKHPIGGIGQNVFNPAIVARVVLLLAFPLEMTTWAQPLTMTGPRLNAAQALSVSAGHIPDAFTGATLLGTFHSAGAAVSASNYDLFMGYRSGSFGEASVALIFLGALWLVWRRVISWHVPVFVLLGLALPAAAVAALEPGSHLTAWQHATSGGALFAAVFIATDPTTSPNGAIAKAVYGAGIGCVTYVIREFCSLPEGIGFAVLLMNALVPTLDRRLKPRVYGRTRSGMPLKPPRIRVERSEA